MLYTWIDPQSADSLKKNDPIVVSAPVIVSDTTTRKKKKKEKKEKRTEEKKTEKGSVKNETSILSQKEISPDSLLNISAQACTCPKKIFKGSLFGTHDLSVKNINAVTNVDPKPYWVSGILLSTLIAFVWIRSSANKRFSRILNAFVNIREFFQLVREEYTMTNGLSIVLTIVYAFSSGLFIYQVNEHYHIFAVTFEPFLFYLSVVACIAGFSIFKLLFSRIIGAVFYNKTDQILPFVYNIFLTNNIIGIVLLPASICLAYIVVIPRDYTIGAALIIILIIYIYRIVRSLSISLNESAVSNVYFFLYLCTLDFIPLIVLLKQLTNQF